MSRIVFTVEEENLICMYHNTDRRRTLVGISDACRTWTRICDSLPSQTIHKLHNMTDAAFEEAKFNMTLSDAE